MKEEDDLMDHLRKKSITRLQEAAASKPADEYQGHKVEEESPPVNRGSLKNLMSKA